jgi:RNA polymerase sigma-70 factor (ECF subfamily)
MMDPSRLGHLVESHGPALVLFARQWTAAPEDVVQEAFLKLMDQPEPTRLVPWLYRVVRNEAINRARAEGRRRRHETRAASQTASWFVPSDDATQEGDQVTTILPTLPDDEREVIVLHLWGGLSFGDIAEIVGGSSSSAHRRYQAGIERLRERLNVPCPNRPNP